MTLLFGAKENRAKNILIAIGILLVSFLSAMWVNLGS
jgi:hypothetical protein